MGSSGEDLSEDGQLRPRDVAEMASFAVALGTCLVCLIGEVRGLGTA